MPARAQHVPATSVPADLAVVLAAPAETIPPPGALPGGCVYEPKWDGWRLLAIHDSGGVRLRTRHGTDVTAAFPDIVAAVWVHTPAGTVLDGELVVWGQGRLDFPALARRAAARGATAKALAAALPASYVTFDVLAAAGQDLRARPWRTRRQALERLLHRAGPPLELTPATSDPAVAADWFATWGAAGVEGLVVKGRDSIYRGGTRDWVKVRHRHTLELVAAAVTGSVRTPRQVVLGAHICGRLAWVGASVTLGAPARAWLADVLAAHDAATGEHPWPVRVPAGVVAGLGASGRDTVSLTRTVPVVLEVAADVAFEHGRFRHPLRLLRARPDSDPRLVTADTIAAARP